MLGDGGSESTRLAFSTEQLVQLRLGADATEEQHHPEVDNSREAGSVVGWHRYLEAKVGLGSDLPARLWPMNDQNRR